jgi:hypothetical protein
LEEERKENVARNYQELTSRSGGQTSTPNSENSSLLKGNPVDPLKTEQKNYSPENPW